MIKTHFILVLALAFAVPALADTDASVHQVYEAVRAGQLSRAQQMMDQVLRDHPKSAKAHYVAAELYAREGNAPLARRELSVAQTLEPGLPFANPEAVRALQAELTSNTGGVPAARSMGTSFPWGSALLALAALGIVGLIFRRRTSPSPLIPQYSGGLASPAGISPGPGIGSGIAGGLATGLAAGAGIVAGEELARHFLDHRDSDGPALQGAPTDQAYADRQQNIDQNLDMGGTDFGVSNDDSWDDPTISGDDWT